jgi:3-keto-disaccharide hydrolase
MTRFAPMLAVLSLTVLAAADEGFVALFDGQTTKGWTMIDGKQDNWTVRDGLLVTKGQGGGWLSTNKMYEDFQLRLEYRVQAAGNSGVFIRAPRQGDPAYTGMEIQILDDNDPKYKSLKPTQYTGSIYDLVAAKRGHTKPPGEWNAFEIKAVGSKVTVILNGATIVDADVAEHSEAVDKHPGLLRKDGYIGLQSHSDPVEFRNIQIKELP